jgi:steroid delta-isomerase-like uncharacterized protein
MKNKSEKILTGLVCLLLLIASGSLAKGAESSSESLLESNKSAIVEFYKAVQSAELESLSSFFTEVYEIQDVGTMKDIKKSHISETSPNIEERIKYLREALPGFEIDVNELIAEGDKVFANVTMTGVQEGAFLGIEPTGKIITMQSFVIFTLERGKIKKALELWDELGVMKQMGYIKID